MLFQGIKMPILTQFAKTESILWKCDAFLWNGNTRLPGTLYLLKDRLEFSLTGFEQSSLSFQVQLKEIEKVETFLLFGFTRNGISIKTSSGHENNLILEEPVKLKAMIHEWMDDS